MDPIAGSLDLLEVLELPALSWGITDVHLTNDDVRNAIRTALDESDDDTTTIDEILFELETRALVTRTNGGHQSNETPTFRTRFAESVRLFSHLRQLFADDLLQSRWVGAPSLVTDYRLLVRPRRFPERKVPIADALAEIEASTKLDTLQTDTLEALAASGGQSLARFQVDATKRILSSVNATTRTATIVAAGTGSGKTRAFYIPGLTDIARRISDERFTKILAIYPRNELLKDQLAEVMSQGRLLRPTLDAHKKRPLVVGAFFGSTPHNRRSAKAFGWAEDSSRALVCPFVTCLTPGCSGSMRWLPGDGDEIRAVLRCSSCNDVIGADELLVTREGMAQEPPDILFTTTEMLNQRLPSLNYRHVFGAGPKAANPPRFMLLDEVHLYSGTTGAQTAFALRRWQHLVGAPVHVVGLSATLEQPEDFVADLTGVPAGHVACVEPSDEDLEDRGAEYLLALRGNPMSQTALLSTTIQALMLLRRILDKDAASPSAGLYGARAFAFTDNLDVANRLHEALCDAEARTPTNQPAPGKEPLAALRNPSRSPMTDLALRRADGQVWDIAERIDQRFDRSRSVELVTGQTSGISAETDLVIATSALEVGFNDPLVGAVLQHKAARTDASFLQRRGRAGRTQQMRPITVIVLSDYGRDRLAYQGYEQLFDPTLRPTKLPIGNRHIQKVQAAAVLLDFLATRLPTSLRGDLWTDLSRPAADETTPWGADTRAVQEAAAHELRAILSDPSATTAFEDFLQQALQLDAENAQAILWSPPRGVLTTAAPTLLRRLESRWSAPGLAGGREQPGGPPMPEHMTSTLFADLALPEVEIEPRLRNAEPLEPQLLSVRLALQELAPGRATKRFAPKRTARHWVPISEKEHQVNVLSFLDDPEEAGSFSYFDNGVPKSIRCLRPIRAHLEEAPAWVRTSQNSRLAWHTELLPTGTGRALELSAATNWSGLIDSVEIHTHRDRSEVEVRRFATGARADHPRNRDQSIDLEFIHRDGETIEHVAIGYTYTADSIRIRLRRPETWPESPSLDRAIRATWFRHLLQTSTLLPDSVNYFSRDWIATLYLATITGIAARHQCDSAAARAKLEETGISKTLRAAMDVIFKVGIPKDPTDGDDPGDGSDAEHAGWSSPGIAQIVDLISDASVCQVVHDAGASLESSSKAPDDAYLARVLASTVGAAFLEAFQRLCPTLDVSQLVLDLDAGPEGKPPDDYLDIWLTEEVVGGAGIVEEAERRSADDVRLLLRLAEAALSATDHERIDAAIRSLAQAAVDDSQTADAIAAARLPGTPAQRRDGLLEILRQLPRLGAIGGHSVATAIAARVLRAGASTELDSILQELVETWEALDDRLGFEAEPRALAFALRDEYARRLEQAVSAPDPDMGAEWRFAQIYSMLWPSGTDARSAGLASHNPFDDLPHPERLLVQAFLQADKQPIDTASPDWRTAVDDVLQARGEASLFCTSSNAKSLRDGLLDLALVPVDTGILATHPRVVGVRSSDTRTVVDLDLAEVI